MNKNSVIMFGIGVVIIAGLVFFLGRKPAQAPVVETPPGPLAIVVNYNSKDQTFTPQTVRVEEGKEAVLKVTSDIADELHFHGYDLHLDLESGKEGQITFTADKTGRFEFELENNKITLGVIEVNPK